MGLTGKLVATIEFKAGGDVFHELLRQNPQKAVDMSPLIHDCQLHEGELGHVGSVLSWVYTDDNKQKFVKERIEKIDEEKKLIEFKIIEGDMMQEFKDFVLTFHVETKNGIDLVTWTFEYEMVNEDVNHPTSLLAYFINATKHIEEHHVEKQPVSV